ncbi:helix-turn-helix transcriptional regulator [Salimicrobium sp. PL1-032A]|uniref:helix-turn-helix transcriptional regulator n=1 Tax=Salimicrobium sp. PL1-032A TaxID=3095364 RepID=UPI0032604740
MKTRMKEYRAKHDLTQLDLAKVVGVRRETISFLEKGEYNPSLKMAVKISRYFGIGVEEMFLFEEDELD